jgi:tellurite resistance protein/uncharacterized protein (DUF697 family)
MTPSEAEAVVGIATLAALADGQQDAQETTAIATVVAQLGLSTDVAQRAASGQVQVSDLATALASDESRQAAYDAALAVCNSDGDISRSERTFLSQLAVTLKIAAPNAMLPVSAVSMTNASAPPTGAAPGELDNHILDQAILTAAMEILPDRLASMAILPLQMRMVYGIGQRHGQTLDAKQITDLAATFGIGAVAQVFEKVIRRTLGGFAGGLLGGLLGGATGVAAGAAVTFAATYALGHASEQYYAQNRSLSVGDMKALFTKFQGDAAQIYPRVQDRIAQRASSTSLSSVMQSIRG